MRIFRGRGGEHKKRVQDFKECFSSAPGRRVLAHLADMTKFYETTHVEDSAHHSAFCEGKRALFAELLNYCNIDEVALNEAAQKTQQEYEEDLGV